MSTPARALNNNVELGEATRGRPSEPLLSMPYGRRPGVSQSPSRPAGSRLADAVVAVGLLVAVVLLGNLDQMPQGLGAFLEIRLSVKNALLLGAFALVWPWVLTVCGLYTPRRLRTGDGEWPRLAVAGAIGCVLAMVFPVTSRSGLVTPWHAVLFGTLIVPAMAVVRSGARILSRTGRPVRQVVLVGSGPIAAALHDQLVSDPTDRVSIVGYVDSVPQKALAGNGATHLGGFQDLDHVLMHRVVDNVCIGLPVKSRYDEIQAAFSSCARLGVPATFTADLFGRGFTHPSTAGHSAPVLALAQLPNSDLLGVKRALDVVVALLLLVVLAPVMLAIAIAIKLTSRGPVLYAQTRYGYMKRLFRMYKFRTMVVGADELQHTLEDRNEASGPVFKIRNDPRITPIGRFLRQWSLDELPQIWHVLTGKMSLVGPRPLPTRDVGKFAEPWLMRRFSMHPGLTCLWQIRGRSDLGFERWIELDLEYIDGWSVRRDLWILLQTVPAVLRRAGAA